MPIQEYVVRERDGLWEVRLRDHLLSAHPTQMGALHVAEALAQTAAACGKRSRILVEDLGDNPVEYPVFEPRPRAAPEQGIEKAPPKRG
jgi:hypothetical protein